MKKQINNEDIKEFKKLDIILTICFILVIVTPIPLAKFLGFGGIAVWVALYAVAMFFAIKAERFKKKHDIQTFREIEAFMNGESIDNIQKIQETAKRPYQKILICICFGVIAFVVCIIMNFVIS